MKTIYKYPLSHIADYITIEVPKGAVFVHLEEQHGIICLWALVDSEAAPIRRQLRVVGTGHPAEDVKLENYIGSVMVLKGTYVWHIFDVGDIFQ